MRFVKIILDCFLKIFKIFIQHFNNTKEMKQMKLTNYEKLTLGDLLIFRCPAATEYIRSRPLFGLYEKYYIFKFNVLKPFF